MRTPQGTEGGRSPHSGGKTGNKKKLDASPEKGCQEKARPIIVMGGTK